MKYPYDCDRIKKSGMTVQFGLCPIEEFKDVLLFELDFYRRRLGNGIYWELENGEEHF
jgi:hypothetical protein